MKKGFKLQHYNNHKKLKLTTLVGLRHPDYDFEVGV